MKSKNTNKKKIDLLHTLLEKLLGDKFEKVKLNFEKYFFNNVLPDYIENPILTELVKLDPIFITSNYDFEIEKHLKRSKQKGSFKPINNINEFVNTGNELRPGDVLHLHGTTEGSWEYFINSTMDYSRQYLKKSEDFKKLSSWFTEREPVVLFLGSSMEEEEILSLLPSTTKNFALMKANYNETSEFRDIYNQTYQKNNTTKIFWYGDTYEELPIKVTEIVKEVQKIRRVPDSLDDWNSLHSVSLSDTEYRKIFEKYANNAKFLFDMFKTEDYDLQNKILKNSLDSEILIEKIINTSSFWEMLRKIEDLNDDSLAKIIRIFQEQNLNIYWTEVFDVFEKISKKTDDLEIENIRKKISKNDELTGTRFSEDPDIMGYWLVNQLSKGRSLSRNIYLNGDKPISINLKKEMISTIVEVTSDEVMYRYSSFKSLISDDLIKIIYESMLSKTMFLENEMILKNFPSELLKSRLFQRILVNIANISCIDESIIEILIKSIDFKDSIFGTELNTFIRKFSLKISSLDKKPIPDYKDGFGEIKSGAVREKSFINSNEIIINNIESILKILLREDQKEQDFEQDFLVEKTFSATSNFLIETLKMKDQASEKIKKLLESKGNILYEKYEKLFVDILIDEELDDEIKETALKIVENEFNFNSFSFEIEKLFEYYIKDKRLDSYLINKLLEVNVNRLDSNYIYIDKERPKLLEVNDFINTELGRYLNIIIEIVKKDNSKIDDFERVINTIEASAFKEFYKGALYEVLDNLDVKEITINTFEGYSYSLIGFREEDLAKFESVGKDILSKGYVSNFNQNNLFRLSLLKINPKENSINWSQINFSILLSYILKSEVHFPYEKQWLEEILIRDEEGKYGASIFQLMGDSESKLDKLNLLYMILEKSVKDYPSKISVGLLFNIMEEQKEDVRKELLINLFFLLLDNCKILEDYFVSKVPINLLKYMDPEFQKKLANHENLSSILSPLEIEHLKRKIL
ncbi:SIR2 family protein [Enterococcus faecium]|nr:SIR2 family protein [Enterococcus faecium]